MEIHDIVDDYSVSSQITPEDVAELVAQGYKTIVCHRPNDEEAGQPNAEAIMEATVQGGIDFFYMPVQTPNKAQGVEFARFMQEFPKPVLAYCRTGNRSATVWAMGFAPILGRDAVVEATNNAGFHLDAVIPGEFDV